MNGSKNRARPPSTPIAAHHEVAPDRSRQNPRRALDRAQTGADRAEAREAGEGRSGMEQQGDIDPRAGWLWQIAGMKWPRITVVTPSFNQALFLERTLASVLSQGYPDLEYLVLDGGSTDGSVEIVKRYADRLAYWRSERDCGQAAALREGFARSTGEVLCWINSDDTFASGALERVGRVFARRPEVDLIHGGLRIVDAQDKRLFTQWAAIDMGTLVYESAFTSQPSSFWRRTIYEKAGGIDESYRFAMDYDLLIRMLLAGARPLKIRRVLASYRLHPATKSSTLQRIGAEEVARTIARHGLAHGSNRVRMLRKYAYRALRFARDPLSLLSAIESRLRGHGPKLLTDYPSAPP
jgi:glycosyltransferase involved in cell wall biosynthesis